MSGGGAMLERSVRWGILATGGIAAAFAADLVDLPDAEIVAVASRSRESAEAFADRFGVARAYGDWASLAADGDIDVVYVATRTWRTGRLPGSAWRPGGTCCARSRSR